MMLRCIAVKQDGVIWTGFIWLRIGEVKGSCQHYNKPSVSINFGYATEGFSRRTQIYGVS
jgi:hypothetical protein